jgi:hypothetical protein
MKTLDDSKPLIFLGDIHGDWNQLFYYIEDKDITNCYIISVGDVGIGFKYKLEYEHVMCEKINSILAERNLHFLGIRGNHDNPAFFTSKSKIKMDHFELLEDYSLLSYRNKTIQLIGGAVSVDRIGRKLGISYWLDEGVKLKKRKCKKVDVLVTHTAPSFCFPQQFNEIVYGWAKEDAHLLKDLTKERAVLDEIFKICSPSLHIYGHFHTSKTEEINECKHRLLDINELWEYNQQNF